MVWSVYFWDPGYSLQPIFPVFPVPYIIPWCIILCILSFAGFYPPSVLLNWNLPSLIFWHLLRFMQMLQQTPLVSYKQKLPPFHKQPSKPVWPWIFYQQVREISMLFVNFNCCCYIDQQGKIPTEIQVILIQSANLHNTVSADDSFSEFWNALISCYQILGG